MDTSVEVPLQYAGMDQVLIFCNIDHIDQASL